MVGMLDKLLEVTKEDSYFVVIVRIVTVEISRTIMIIPTMIARMLAIVIVVVIATAV